MGTLSDSFSQGSKAGARNSTGLITAAAVFGGGLAAGVGLAALAVAGIVATCYLAVTTFVSIITYAMPAMLVMGGLTIAAAAVGGLSMQASAFMFGAAKGAFMSDLKPQQAPQQPADIPQTYAPVDVKKYAGKPPGQDFNQSATPASTKQPEVKVPRFAGHKPQP